MNTLKSDANRSSAGRGSSSARAIERIEQHLRENFNQPVSLDELTALAKLSRFHLVRTFALHIGVSPHAYQLQLRIDRACALLRAGTTAAEVATLVGFADQSHFTRHFKRICRITPGRYARMHSAGRAVEHQL